MVTSLIFGRLPVRIMAWIQIILRAIILKTSVVFLRPCRRAVPQLDHACILQHPTQFILPFYALEADGVIVSMHHRQVFHSVFPANTSYISPMRSISPTYVIVLDFSTIITYWKVYMFLSGMTESMCPNLTGEWSDLNMWTPQTFNWLVNLSDVLLQSPTLRMVLLDTWFVRPWRCPQKWRTEKCSYLCLSDIRQWTFWSGTGPSEL
jgi:hypothetical protein